MKKKQWYLGFLGLLAFLGVSPLVAGDWLGASWLVWVLWFTYFLPEKTNPKQ